MINWYIGKSLDYTLTPFLSKAPMSTGINYSYLLVSESKEFTGLSDGSCILNFSVSLVIFPKKSWPFTLLLSHVTSP
jgi:hypothetical protein